MKNKEEKIKTLRTFFRVSNAVFEFQNSIQLACTNFQVTAELRSQMGFIACYRLPFLSLSINNLKLKICTKFSQ